MYKTKFEFSAMYFFNDEYKIHTHAYTHAYETLAYGYTDTQTQRENLLKIWF